MLAKRLQLESLELHRVKALGTRIPADRAVLPRLVADGLDVVSIGIGDEGGVVGRVVMLADAGCPLIRTSR